MKAWGYRLGVVVCLALCNAPSQAQIAQGEHDAALHSSATERPVVVAQRTRNTPKSSVTTPPLQLSQTQDTTGTIQTTAPRTPVGAPVPQAVEYNPQTVKSQLNVMLLMDASGSMRGPMGSISKMDHVKEIVKDVLTQQAPQGIRRSFGLQAFGSQSAQESNDCNDTLTVSALGSVKAADLGTKIDSLTPRGTSPVGRALREAAAAMPAANSDSDNILLLFADGADTCGEDPCAIAKEIHNGVQRAIVHVIGFDLDQTATTQLRCVAEATSGRFFLARTTEELRSHADQAMNANLPYNLRVKVFAGDTPLPTTMTVYRSGTRTIVEEGKASGVKFFQLAPGSYDIQIEYSASLENSKPAKMLKGVEIQTTARAEQIVRFELGTLALSGFAPDGEAIPMSYTLKEQKTGEILAEFEGDTDSAPYLVSPGTYTVVASSPPINGIPLQGTAEKLSIVAGQQTDHAFRFESGELFLRAETSNGDFVEGRYEIVTPEQPDIILSEGRISQRGTTIPLPVGSYTASVYTHDPELSQDAIVLKDVTIESQEMLQQLVSFPVGTVRVAGKSHGGSYVSTRFDVRRDPSSEPIRTLYSDKATEFALAPGDYHITATRHGGEISPAPTLIWDDVSITSDKPFTREALFSLGQLQLTGIDARSEALRTEFTLYRSGSSTPLITKSAPTGTTSFKLTPGVYDVQARDISAKGNVRPMTWLRGIVVTAGGSVERSIVFTAGRVRLTCRGTNDKPIHCDFRLFTYGQDAPLVAGNTYEEWKEFEMKPGYYYLEVGIFDAKRDHELTKWINIAVAENETVEQVVRF